MAALINLLHSKAVSREEDIPDVLDRKIPETREKDIVSFDSALQKNFGQIHVVCARRKLRSC